MKAVFLFSFSSSFVPSVSHIIAEKVSIESGTLLKVWLHHDCPEGVQHKKTSMLLANELVSERIESTETPFSSICFNLVGICFSVIRLIV